MLDYNQFLIYHISLEAKVCGAGDFIGTVIFDAGTQPQRPSIQTAASGNSRALLHRLTSTNSVLSVSRALTFCLLVRQQEEERVV